MTDIDDLRWWKSSRSGNQGQCVEVAVTGSTWCVRDSKNPAGPHLAVSNMAWQSFVAALKEGEL